MTVSSPPFHPFSGAEVLFPLGHIRARRNGPRIRTQENHRSLRREPGETISPSFNGIRFPYETATRLGARDGSRSVPLTHSGRPSRNQLSTLVRIFCRANSLNGRNRMNWVRSPPPRRRPFHRSLLKEPPHTKKRERRVGFFTLFRACAPQAAKLPKCPRTIRLSFTLTC